MTVRPARSPRVSPVARFSNRLRSFPRRGVLLACLAGTVLSVSSPWVRTAIAEPRGARVVAGNVNINQNGNKTVIRASNGSIINYDSFNIGAGEIVRFIQPNSQSRVLNRITGNQPTLIQGSLFANGKVFFINTAGITFSSTAVVSTGGIVAAAVNISDADFAAGRFHFKGEGQGGTVRNDGTLSGQMVGLIGKQVINTGTINAGGGWVFMAAGDDVFIGESGRRVLVKADLSQGQAQTPGAGVEHTGTINADGGRADFAAGDLYSTALRISGVTTAQKVRAVATGQGAVEVTGRINASNQGENSTGGRVHVLGHTVTLDGATIDATGTNGGGEIRIGGDYLGGPGLPTADTTTVKNGTHLDASATGSGSGGSIVVWSDRLTSFEGTALADSTLSFRGGLVETSSAGTLNVGEAIIGARGGTWLLDPAGDLVIGNSDPGDGSSFVLASTLNTALNGGGLVSSAFDETSMMVIPLHATGSIFITANIAKTSGGNATLQLTSDHGIDLATGVSISNTSMAGALDLILSWGSGGTGTLTTNLTSFNSAGFSGLRTVTYDLAGGVVIQGTATAPGEINATSMISALLNTGTNVRVLTTGGNINAISAITKSAGGDCTLTFQADASVIFSSAGGITAGGGGVGKLHLNLLADTPADTSGLVQILRPITLNGGDFYAEGTAISVAGSGSLMGLGKMSLLLDSGAEGAVGYTATSYEIGGRSGTLTLSANFTLATAVSLTFTTAVDANNRAISINTGAAKILFLGDVTNAAGITLTSTNAAADAISVRGISGSGSVAGSQRFNGNTTLNGTYTIGTGASSDFTVIGNTTLAGDTSITNTVGADGSLRAIHFTGSINSLTGNNFELSMNAGANRIALDSGAGTTTQLSRLVATGSQIIIAGAGVKTVGDGSMNPSQHYTGTTTLFGTCSTQNTGFLIDGNAILSGASVILDSGSGDLTINGGISGPGSDLSLRSSGLAKVTGNISGVGAFTTDTSGTAAGTTQLDGTLSAISIGFFDLADLRGSTYTSTTGSQSYGQNVTNNGAGNIAFVASAAGQSITFSGDFIGGSHALTTTTSGAGATVFNGGHSAAASAITINGNLSLVGIASQAVSLDTGATNGTIDLDAVNGTPGLMLDAGAGQIIFGAAVGGSTPIGSLDANAASIAIQNVSTAGAQNYHGAVTLSGASVTLAASGGSLIAFDSTITGTVTSLTVNTSGNTSFGDDVSLGTGGLTTDATGTTTLEAAGAGFDVTAGPINIQDNLVLTSGAYRFLSYGGSSAANRNQSFGGTITAINNGASLVLDAGNIGVPLAEASRGNITVTGAIGDTGANLGALQVFANLITLHDATTAGTQSFSGADVTLNGVYDSGSSLFTVAGTTAIRMGSNVSVATTNNATFTGAVLLQGHDLAVNADGATRFTSTVSGTGELSTNAAGTSRFDSTINVGSLSIGDDASLFGATATTSGDMTFGNRLTLETDVTLASTAGDIRLLGIVDGLGVVNAVNHSLTLNVANAHFSLIDATAININQLLSSATGKVQIRESASPTVIASLVNLSGGLELLGTAGQTVFIDTSAANGTITLNAIDGPAGLSLNSGTAKIVLNGAAGATTALGSFSATSTNAAADAITIRGVRSVNDQDYHGKTTVAGATATLQSTSGNIVFDATLVGASTALTINSPGNTAFGGDVTLASLVTDSPGQTLLGTAGQSLFTLTGGPVSILDDAVIRADMCLVNTSAATNKAITFGKTISADTMIIGAGEKLTLNAGGSSGGNIAVGGVITVGELMVSGAVVTVNGAITNIGGQMITGMRVYLSGIYDTGSADFYVGLNTGSNSIWLAENSLNTHKVTVSSTGNITFDAPLNMRGFDLDVHTAVGKIAKFNFAISNTIVEPGLAFGGSPITHNPLNTARLLVDGPGSVEFHGSVGDTALPDYLALGSITVGSMSDMTAASAFGALYNTVNNITFYGPLTLETDAAFRSSAGDISFLKAVQGTGVVNTVAHDLHLDVANSHFALLDAGASGLDALTSAATGEVRIRTTAGNTVVARSIDLFNDLVLMGTNAGTVTLTSAANDGPMRFRKTITGAANLNLDAGEGAVAIDGAVSGLASLVGNAGSYSLNSVSTVGNQTYGIDAGTPSGMISLLSGSDPTFASTGGGNISFGGGLDGNANDLTVNTTGDTTFRAITDLAGLTTDASGHTIFLGNVSAGSLDIRDVAQIHAATIQTTGFQSYSAGSPSDTLNPGVNSIELFASTSLLGNGISMYKVAGGNFDLASQSSSTTDFRGDISGVNLLTTSASGAGTVVHDGVTVSVHQAIFGDNTVISDNAAVNAGGAGSSVTFQSTATLQDNAAVTATGAGALAAFQGFTFLGENAAITATGSGAGVTFDQGVSLTGASAAINAVGAGSTIIFSDTIDGAGALTIASTGSVEFGGDVGSIDALASLAVHGAVTLDAFALSFNTTGDTHFYGTIDGATFLTLSSSAGDVTLDGGIGQTTALSSLDISGDVISLNSVRTQGHQVYTGSGSTRLLGAEYRTLNSINSIPPGGSLPGTIPEVLGEFRVMGNTVIGANTTIHTSTGLVTFLGAINGLSADTYSLTIQVDNARSTSRLPAVRFAGNIGSAVSLAGLYLNTSHGTATITGGGTRDNASVLFAGEHFFRTDGVYNADGRLTSFPDVKLPGSVDPTVGYTFQVNAGTFEMSAGARLLSFGNLAIDGGHVTLNSLNVVGTLDVNATTLDFVGGANIVSSGQMTLHGLTSSNPNAFFGINQSGNPIAGDAIFGGRVRRLGGDLSFASFQVQDHITITDNLSRGDQPPPPFGPDTLVILQPADGIPLDFINTFTISPTISDQDTVRRFEPASVGALADGLKEFNLDLLDLDPLQITEFFVGRSLYTDLPGRIPARASSALGYDFKVTRNRLQRDTLEGLLNALKDYLGEVEGGVRKNAKVRGEEVGTAWEKFCKDKQPEDCTIEGFRAFLEGPEATPEARKSFEDLDAIMSRIRELGLSPQESRIVRKAVVSKLQKGNKTWDIRVGKPADAGARKSSLAELLEQHFNENVQLTAR